MFLLRNHSYSDKDECEEEEKDKCDEKEKDEIGDSEKSSQSKHDSILIPNKEFRFRKEGLKNYRPFYYFYRSPIVKYLNHIVSILLKYVLNGK